MGNITSRTEDTTPESTDEIYTAKSPFGPTDDRRASLDNLPKGLGAFPIVQFLTGQADPAYGEGKLFYDDVNKTLGFYNDESDSTLQIGQELWGRFVNATGSQIDNGQVIYISGESGGLNTVLLAKADAAATSIATIAIATHDVGIGAIGVFTKAGTVRGFDTAGAGFSAGDNLWLSGDTAGAITNVQPVSPNFSVFIGNAGVIDADGTIEVNINVGGNTGDVIKIFNGAILEDHSIAIVESAGTVSLTLEKSGGGDLSLFFDAQFTAFSAPPATVALTAGSDVAPTLNYVYIPKSTNTLTANTTGFPTTEQFVPVATVLVQSAASVATDGAYKVHAWTDHLSDSVDEGHIQHVNAWIRNQNATWQDGVAPTTTITVNGGAIDNVDFANSSGNVLQLHSHAFPALDTSGTDPVFVINDSATAYDRILDLGDIDTDSLGATLRSNNTYYSLVIWGVVSEEDADCKLYCNVPGGSYISETTAINDPNGYSNFTIPADFRGTGFLIARVVLRYQTAASGTFSEVQTEDLRGLMPSTAAGGGAQTSGTEFSDNLFRIFAVADNTKELALDISGVTTSTTRTITIPDRDLDLGSPTFDAISMAGAIDEFQGANIASATTTDIGAATGNFVFITGTTTITGLGTVQAGTKRVVKFVGILTLTHNATSLILPTEANIPTAADDRAEFVSLGSGNWICTNYQRADGTALAAAGGSVSPIFLAATDFAAAGRYNNTSGAGGITTYALGGMKIDTLSSSGGFTYNDWNLSNQTGFDTKNGSPMLSMVISIGLQGANVEAFLGLGPITIAGGGITFTNNHIGFKVLGTTLYATVADGSTESATSLGTMAVNEIIELIAVINGSDSVDFYTRRQGGALSAATNIATNLPTATLNQNFRFGVSNASTTDRGQFYIGQSHYQR